MKLTDFKVLTFDCYGTLIDWETGIWNALQPLIGAGGLKLDREEALARFGKIESELEEAGPSLRYSTLLAAVHARLAKDLGVHIHADLNERFGGSVPDWPAFPDSAEALAYLKRHYKLVILSNVDRTSFAASNRKLGVTFDAIYTAEDIGSYKPDLRNFAYLLAHLEADLGLKAGDVLHTAQGRAGRAGARLDRPALRHGRQRSDASSRQPAEGRLPFQEHGRTGRGSSKGNTRLISR